MPDLDYIIGSMWIVVIIIVCFVVMGMGAAY